MSSELASVSLEPLPIYFIRSKWVCLDSDLARAFGVETKRLNEVVKRKSARFGDQYTFQSDAEEWADLRSQFATASEKAHGGRRTPPWLFTEHGVVMVATLLDTDAAVNASKVIVGVFVDANRFDSNSVLATNENPKAQAMKDRVQALLNQVLDTMVDVKQNRTVRQEAQALIAGFLANARENLRKAGLENLELEAKVSKLLAEAEHERERTAKTRAETKEIEIRVFREQVNLLQELLAMFEGGSPRAIPRMIKALKLPE